MLPRRLPIVIFSAVLLLGLLGATAAAHEGASRGAAPFGQAPCEPEHVEHLGPACELDDGLYRVFLEDGTTLTTHGPDPAPSSHDLGFFDGAEERAPYCTDQHHMHVLYGHPSAQPDRSEAVEEELRDIIKRMNAILNADGMASGGTPTDYKVKCDEDGTIAVDTFTGPETGSAAYTADFSEIVDAARDAGYDDGGVNYLIFYDDDGGSVCGVGNFHNDDRLSEDNENLVGPNYGATYESCWDGRTPMHENAHNMGAVQRLAPLADGNAHCLEGYDVMCYTSSYVGPILCSDRVYFDCNHQTYFHTNPDDDAWLASHWNLGHRLNRFLAFDSPNPPSALFTHDCNGARCAFDASQSEDPDGEIQAYSWDLGDGNTASGESLEHTYDEGGTYTVTLTVTGATGVSDTHQETLNVEPEDPPAVTARFTHACQLDPCTFNASSSQAREGEIATYQWEFGDGNTSTGATVEHAYAKPGMYTVALTVTTQAGESGSTAKDVLVREATTQGTTNETLAPHNVSDEADQQAIPGWDAVPLDAVTLLGSFLATSLILRRHRASW